MTVMTTPTSERNDTLLPGGVRRPPTVHELMTDDGEPMESYFHVMQMMLLIDSLTRHWGDRDDVFCGGNQFMYFSPDQVKTHDYRGPDFYAVCGNTTRQGRLAWVVWEEDGRTPDCIIELHSPATRHVDLGVKKDIYEQRLHIKDYVVYEPLSDAVQGWHLTGDGYVPMVPNAAGRLPCPSIGLEVGVWHGRHLKTPGNWLRFFLPDGQLVQTAAEAAEDGAQRAETEAQRARDAEARVAELEKRLASLEGRDPS